MSKSERIQQQPLLMAQTSIIENDDNINNRDSIANTDANANANASQQTNFYFNSDSNSTHTDTTTTFEQNPVTRVLTNSEKIKSRSGAESTSPLSSQVDVSLSGAKNLEADDKVSLTLLLVSGKRHTFSFDPNDTILTVKKEVFNYWPREWADETPDSVSSLKIVYRGRFLEDTSTLESNKILRGQSTIAHLTFKNISTSDIEDLKVTENAPKCHCIIL